MPNYNSIPQGPHRANYNTIPSYHPNPMSYQQPYPPPYYPLAPVPPRPGQQAPTHMSDPLRSYRMSQRDADQHLHQGRSTYRPQERSHQHQHQRHHYWAYMFLFKLYLNKQNIAQLSKPYLLEIESLFRLSSLPNHNSFVANICKRLFSQNFRNWHFSWWPFIMTKC